MDEDNIPEIYKQTYNDYLEMFLNKILFNFIKK